MAKQSNDNVAEKSARNCPICSKPGVAEYQPFCSKRCADVDLGRWLGGRYAIAADEAEEPERRPGENPAEI